MKSKILHCLIWICAQHQFQHLHLLWKIHNLLRDPEEILWTLSNVQFCEIRKYCTLHFEKDNKLEYILHYLQHTVRNLHFLSKNSTLISRENCQFLGVKNSWKCCGFGLFSCWQLWFHEKNCQKIWCETRFVKIEFLDKNLTFRIVWWAKRDHSK